LASILHIKFVKGKDLIPNKKEVLVMSKKGTRGSLVKRYDNLDVICADTTYAVKNAYRDYLDMQRYQQETGIDRYAHLDHETDVFTAMTHGL
jgi:hypothetical protein